MPRQVPPPPVPVVAGATGDASRIPGGLRVTFGPGSSDLNQSTEAALRDLGRQLKANEAAVVNVFAYAPGQPEDPSTPRRVSLSRALAARAVLISEGVASPRMIVRAEGSRVPDGPADRVDVVLVGTPQAAPAPAAPSATPPPQPSSR